MKNIFLIRDLAHQAFGKNAFEHGLFYLHERSLRFELSVEGSFVELFNQALSKGIEILDNVFGKQNDLYACVSFYGGKGLLANLSIFKQLKSLDIELNKSSCEIWQEPYPQEENDDLEKNYFRTFIIFPIGRTEMLSLLWSAVASDFNISPRVSAHIYFFSSKLQILAHPYDDRGMDIIGANHDLKQMLFDCFNNYLLDYDLKIMNKNFIKR